MKTVVGNISQIYEITYPSKKTSKRRFLLHTDIGNLFMTLFNNTELIREFKIEDHVRVQYSTETKTVGDKQYTDHYVSSIKLEQPRPVLTLEDFQSGREINFHAHALLLLSWIKAHHQSLLTISDIKLLTIEFIGKRYLPIKLFHDIIKEAVRSTSASTPITLKLLFKKLAEIPDQELDF